MGDWTFFSNHGHVLVCLSKNHETRLRDVALEVGITERAVQKIVRDFQDAGIVTITKQGRCNRYRINRRKALRHNLVTHCTVGQLLSLVSKPSRRGSGAEIEVEDEAEPPAIEPSAVASEPMIAKAGKVQAEEAQAEEAQADSLDQRSLF